MSDFSLHPRLAADTVFIADRALSRVLLMNDARYPWLILVPRRDGVTELFDLKQSDRATLMEEISRAARDLKEIGGVAKINVGALGNLVPQLHVHVVARRPGDAAWPGPVWGQGTAIQYDAARRDALVAALRVRFQRDAS
jgi:diadenosine tetraphosphate (Ap4A) HIT family hydrolase